MTAREWKPGDVAIVTAMNRREGYRATFDGTRWREYGSSTGCLLVPTSIRPLVVIDPEDREQVERLRDLMDAEVIRQNDDPDPRDVTPGARGNALQAALREFVNPKPPKPEEPTGRFAEVVDSTGDHWFLMYADETKSAPWARDGCFTAPTTWRGWRDIDAVMVLSDGIPA